MSRKTKVRVSCSPPLEYSAAETRAHDHQSFDLIIIAGVSGSGKSTLLKDIKSGRLTRALALPVGVERWPVVGSSHCIPPSGAPGFILHYDMNGRGIWRGADFKDDPALSLIERANTITVINLRPSLGLLVKQLTDRELVRLEEQQRDRGRLIWRLTAPAVRIASLVLPRRTAKAIRRRTPFRYSEERLLNKLRVYQEPGWLDDIYARWAQYVTSVSSAGGSVRQIFLERDVGTTVWKRLDVATRPGPVDTPQTIAAT